MVPCSPPVVCRSTSSDSEPAPVAAPPVVASTSLAALPKHEGGGEAEIVSTRDRARSSSSTSSELSAGEGFYEVWLIDPETFQMVGLGALPATRGASRSPTGST